MRPSFVLAGALALITLCACNRSEESTAVPADNGTAPALRGGALRPAAEAPALPAPPPPVEATRAPSADPTRLPEDPEAAKRASAQWDEHLEHEEEERQMIFDHNRLKEHRALVKVFAAARAKVDRARNAAAIEKARAEMPQQLAEIQKRVTEIDHWGNNSRVLPNYAALSTALGGPYLDAKLAALEGDQTALKQARASFDDQLKTITSWLAKAEEGEDEEREGEHEAEAEAKGK